MAKRGSPGHNNNQFFTNINFTQEENLMLQKLEKPRSIISSEKGDKSDIAITNQFIEVLKDTY